MRQTRQQQIGNLGESLAKIQLEKLGMLVSKPGRDFGFDLLVQAADDQVVTPKWIAAQVKSTVVGSAKHESGVYVNVKANDLKFWQECNVPAILIAVDVKKEKCFWKYVANVKSEPNRETIRVYFNKHEKLNKSSKSKLLKIASPSLFEEDMLIGQKRQKVSEHWGLLRNETHEGNIFTIYPKHDKAHELSPQITKISYKRGSSAAKKFDEFHRSGEMIVLHSSEFERIDYPEIFEKYGLPEATGLIIRQLSKPAGKFYLATEYYGEVSKLSIDLIRESAGSETATFTTLPDSPLRLTWVLRRFADHFESKLSFEMQLGRASVTGLVEAWSFWQKITTCDSFKLVNRETEEVLLDTGPDYKFPNPNLSYILDKINTFTILQRIQHQLKQTIALPEQLTENQLAEISNEHLHLIYDGIGFYPADRIESSFQINQQQMEELNSRANGHYVIATSNDCSLNLCGNDYELGISVFFNLGVRISSIENEAIQDEDLRSEDAAEKRTVTIKSDLGVVVISLSFCSAIREDSTIDELNKIADNVIRFIQGEVKLEFCFYNYGTQQAYAAGTLPSKKKVNMR